MSWGRRRETLEAQGLVDGSRSQGRGIRIPIAPVQNTGCYIPAPIPSPPLQEMGGIPLKQEENRSPVPAGALACSIHPCESLDSWLPPSLPQDQKVPHSFLLKPVKSSSKEAGPSHIPSRTETEEPPRDTQPSRASSGPRPPSSQSLIY